MTTLNPLETEKRLLQTLDRQLLKIADKLDESFDPDDKEAVKMLKLFRSMMLARRSWAKEYNLVQVPEPAQAAQTMERLADVKIADENSQKKPECITESLVAGVASRFPMNRKERRRQKRNSRIR